MKNNNYATGFGWMFNEFNLKCSEAWVFALIHGFSQDGQSKFAGSITYIASTFNLTTRQVIRILQNLEAKGVIVKHQVRVNNITKNNYSLGSKVLHYLGSEKMSPGSEILSPGGEKMSPGGGEKMSPNITSIYKLVYTPGSAFEFVILNHPSRLQQEFLIPFEKQFKSQANFDKFIRDFNNEAEMKSRPFGSWLVSMIKKYGENWLNFHNKLRVVDIAGAGLERPDLKRIG